MVKSKKMSEEDLKRLDEFDLNEYKRARDELIKIMVNTQIKFVPALFFPLIDAYLKLNPKEHGKFIENKYGWKKL